MRPLRDLSNFGRLHRSLRQDLGMTREDLARELGEHGYMISASAIGKYENAERNVPAEYIQALRHVDATEEQRAALAQAHCDDYESHYLAEIR